LSAESTGGLRKSFDLSATFEALLRLSDHRDRAGPARVPQAVLPDRGAALVDADQGHAGQLALRRLDPAVAEGLEVRQDGRPGNGAERARRPPLEAVRPRLANQGVGAQRHRARREAGEDGALAPRLEDRRPHSRVAQDLDDVPGVAADEVEETAPASRFRELLRVGVGALEHAKLLERQP